MPSRRRFILSVAGISAALGVVLPSVAKAASTPVSATAVTKVFGDGLRFVAVALEFRRDVDGKALNAGDFRISGRTITGVYTATSADPADRSDTGRFVIISLSPDDAGAPLLDKTKVLGGPGKGMPGKGPWDGKGPGGPGGPGGPDGAPPPPDGPRGPGGPGGPGGRRGPGIGNVGEKPSRGYDMYFLTPAAMVEQVKPLRAADGSAIPASKTKTGKVKNLIVDDFKLLRFSDPATGDTLPYNLFVPRDYDPSKRYPLVLFMHDAGATSDVPRTTLLQGLGAICWASPEDQAKRPSFVVAPQYDTIITDNTHASSMLETTIHLVQALSGQYSIDTDRLYTTGQSGGCMVSIAMNIKYPGFFAASFLVAGQWDPAQVAPIAGCKLWVMVSQDDPGAFPGENAIMQVLEAKGAKIARAEWDGRWSAGQFRTAFDKLDAAHSPINYISFVKGSVIPPGMGPERASAHRNTWRIAYTIEPVREWIFRQHK